MDNNKILEKFKTKIAISNGIEDSLITSKSTIKLGKSVLILLGLLLITAGTTMAANQLIRKFGYNASDGVQTAVDNDYVSNINTEYKDSDGISISIDSFLIDDTNFAITFDFEFDNTFDLSYVQKIDISNLKIVNEKGEKVFVTTEAEIEEAKKLYATEDEMLEKYDFYHCGYSTNHKRLESNKIRYYLTSTSGSDFFPVSQKLYVTFSTIKFNDFIGLEAKSETYRGEWSYEIDVPSKMAKSNIVKFKLKSISDKNYEFIDAQLSNTSFKIYLTNCTGMYFYNKEPYIETTDGKKFYSSKRSDGDGGIGTSLDGKVTFYNTFNLTNYDATDTIKVHLFKDNGEEVTIELVRE